MTAAWWQVNRANTEVAVFNEDRYRKDNRARRCWLPEITPSLHQWGVSLVNRSRFRKDVCFETKFIVHGIDDDGGTSFRILDDLGRRNFGSDKDQWCVHIVGSSSALGKLLHG